MSLKLKELNDQNFYWKKNQLKQVPSWKKRHDLPPWLGDRVPRSVKDKKKYRRILSIINKKGAAAQYDREVIEYCQLNCKQSSNDWVRYKRIELIKKSVNRKRNRIF